MRIILIEPYLTIVCPITGVEIRIDRTNGGTGRISQVKVYDNLKTLQVSTMVSLNGSEVETSQRTKKGFKTLTEF